MPNLIRVSDFRLERGANSPKLHPCLYFTDAYLDIGNQWKFTIERDYPYLSTIHIDVVDDITKESARKFWINLRKWVERSCAGDVLHEYKRMDYSWWWNREAKSDYQKNYSQVKHGYWYLYFECESDYTMFTLMHGDKTSKVQKYHPEFGENVLEQDKIYGKVD